ncbi:MAG: 4a-hydroxytetrahydrobiopterin dehydratase [Albidovulum sp.]|nr:4a-hydroxytetrahydrobiopterin dehydratase [Albidovulum sp.]MDE0532266.1 4a-hydroxytetrahydrobiopterin dehydratase [Albidovulum sp.]
MPNRLDQESRKELLGPIFNSGWEMVEGRDALCKRFQFKNFSEAFGWMTRVAMFAEKINHHPEWANVYGRVDVTLATHSASGITELDLRMAKKMEALVASSK